MASCRIENIIKYYHSSNIENKYVILGRYAGLYFGIKILKIYIFKKIK